jgi:transcription initiation factor TFIIB
MIEQAGCKNCQSMRLIQDSVTGEVVCLKCGLVVKEQDLDLSNVNRAFSFNEREEKSRHGYAISDKMYDKGLSTTFQVSSDTGGKKLGLLTRIKMLRLRHYHERTRTNEYSKRNLKTALPIMHRICKEANLPTYVNDEAAKIYRKVLHRGLIKGRSIEGFVAASIYMACRLFEIPRYSA